MLADKFENRNLNTPPLNSAFGSLLNAITEEKEYFQPTNINFGLMPPYAIPEGDKRKKIPKRERRDRMLVRAKESFENWLNIDNATSPC